jgi:predicted small metal-binding protein
LGRVDPQGPTQANRPRRIEMAYVINCECGYVARGEDEDALVADTEQHVRDQHPEMAEQMTREQILAMAEEE